MVTYAKIRTDGVVFSPILATPIPNMMFVNLALGSALCSNTSSGTTEEVATGAAGGGGEGSGTNYLLKQMQAADVIRSGRTISKRQDGKIVEAESDAAGAQQPIGVALQNFAVDEVGNVLLMAPNATGVLDGMGFLPGQEIFIGETTGGYVNDVSPFIGSDDSIVKVGVADCPSGVATGLATDLILISQVIARP